jgi:hypothetical protein
MQMLKHSRRSKERPLSHWTSGFKRRFLYDSQNFAIKIIQRRSSPANFIMQVLKDSPYLCNPEFDVFEGNGSSLAIESIWHPELTRQNVMAKVYTGWWVISDDVSKDRTLVTGPDRWEERIWTRAHWMTTKPEYMFHFLIVFDQHVINTVLETWSSVCRICVWLYRVAQRRPFNIQIDETELRFSQHI